MSYWQMMRRIILPQAARIAVTPLFYSFIGLVKDTSLAAGITIPEMLMVTQRAVAVSYEPLLLYSVVAVVYLVFCTALNILQGYLEKYLVYGRRG